MDFTYKTGLQDFTKMYTIHENSKKNTTKWKDLENLVFKPKR